MTTTFIFHLIPHTHWDREWYLPRAAFHARLIPMLDELIDRLQTDASFRTFLLDGQTVIVEDYLRARPEREGDVKALVKTGRFQVGPWYVLADELIPSGESLIRNLLLGAADAERLGGRLDVLYSPDAFGHPAVLPTLAREFGLKYGVLWRGLGGRPGQERDFFRWRGSGGDSREILLWHLPPEGYEIGAALPGAGARLPDLWTQVRATLVQRAAGKHIPLFVGADHHAPHPALARLRDLLADLEPASAFRISRLDEFFQAAESTPATPIEGELRWSYGYTWTLQGVHGTRAPLKRRHGQIVTVDWGSPLDIVTDITVFRRNVLVGPPSEGRRRAREGTGYRPFSLYDREGRAIPVQVLAQRPAQERREATRHYPDQDEVDQVRIAFRAPSVPGLGIAALTSGPPVPRSRSEEVRVRGRTLENRFVAVSLERNGALTLHDRRRNERYGDLLRLEDGGDAGDAYSYCPPVRDRIKPSRGPIAVRRLAGGPLVAALEARWEVVRGVDARLVVQLFADSPIVRVTLDVDNRNRYHRLRARLMTGLGGVPATAGAPFGAVERPAVNASPDGAQPARETPVRTAPAHRFVAAAHGPRGLAVLAPACFEYECTARGDLLVTLLRAIGDLSRGDLPTRPGHAGWPTAIPAAQSIGSSRIDLAIVPVSAGDIERGDVLPQLWEDAFLPLHGLWLRDAAAPLTITPVSIALEGSGLVYTALKPAQIGSPTVLRCYNATSRKAAGAWRFANGVKTAHRVRADEREAVALVLEQRGNIVRFVAEPHEIVSILVT